MERKSYFTLPEWAIIISLAVVSALINSYLPIKGMVEYFGIPGPAAGMALFGGIIFVLWICLARQITGKKYSGIITSVLIASICLLIHPWYGVMSPTWFSIYGIIALLCMGVMVELMGFRSFWWGVVGGGLGNLICLVVTWLAIGFHTGVWISQGFAPLLISGALISGGIGAWLAHEITQMIKAERQTW